MHDVIKIPKDRRTLNNPNIDYPRLFVRWLSSNSGNIGSVAGGRDGLGKVFKFRAKIMRNSHEHPALLDGRACSP